MSIKSVLIIDNDLEVNVLSFNFSYKKQADSNGKQTGKAIFNGIRLVVESRKELDLSDWAFARNQTKQLEIHIFPRLLDKKIRKLTLYDCHLLKWDNDFFSIGKEPLKETLHISCGGVKDSNSSKQYSTYWRETFDTNVEPTVIPQNEEDEIHIISCNYTDREGNLISEIYEGDEITLTVVTEDCVGKPINIDLTQFEFGFKYKGKIVKNNILENIKVTADSYKIDLEVIEKEES